MAKVVEIAGASVVRARKVLEDLSEEDHTDEGIAAAARREFQRLLFKSKGKAELVAKEGVLLPTAYKLLVESKWSSTAAKAKAKAMVAAYREEETKIRAAGGAVQVIINRVTMHGCSASATIFIRPDVDTLGDLWVLSKARDINL